MKTIPIKSKHVLQQGISYVELLVATVLIAIAIVPMMNALQAGLQGSTLFKKNAEFHHVLTGAAEKVLAEPFDNLDAAATAAGAYTTATTYSDLGAPTPFKVYLWRYDVDNADSDNDEFTGGEEDLIWVRVALVDNGQSIETLISKF